MSVKAKFKPRNPEKYLGDLRNICARSSWELHAMHYFDKRKGVIEWSSEPIHIRYISPVDNEVHEYIPDFYVKYKDKENVIHEEIVEIKPRHEADEEHAKSERSKAALLINNAKWNAARDFCLLNNMQFRVVTEIDLFNPKKKVNGKI